MAITVTIEEKRDIVEIVDRPYIIELRPGWVSVTNTEVDQILTSAGTISIGKAVYINASGEVAQADADNIATKRVIGIAVTSATVGNPCTVRTFGSFTHASYAFTTGEPVFVGSTGTLVDSPDGTGYVVLVGSALASDTVYVNVQQPIELV